MTFAIRSGRTGREGFLDEIQRAIWSVNASVPLARVLTLGDLYDRSMAQTSFALVMLAIAGTMALVLGIVGIYGVIAYAVTQRRREIGIRVALGAQRGALKRMFVRQGLGLASLGIACGVAAAMAITRVMSFLLFDISSLDPATYLAGSLLLLMAAAVASYVPAPSDHVDRSHRRAARRVNPGPTAVGPNVSSAIHGPTEVGPYCCRTLLNAAGVRGYDRLVP